jgi:TolB-like protein
MLFRFGSCSLDSDRRELTRNDEVVAIEPQVFDLLVYLVQHRDRVVSRDDLLAAVWGGRIVSESTLASRINAARSAIGDSGSEQQLIRTIARKGFRFVGEVREGPSVSDAGSTGPPAARPAISVGGSPQLPDKPSIAVLPFTNMSGDPEQEYFSDGITEDIITALSRLRWFFVIARNSTLIYKGKPADVKQVGRDLGVRYVLEGSVRKSGPRVRISSQLLDAITGNHIWAERYDRELTDIFALQDEITASVTAAIEPKLLAAEGLRAETRSTENLDAWDLVARAMSLYWKLTADDSAGAIALLRLAADRYPNYGPANCMLAFVHLASAHIGWVPAAADRTLAIERAHRAVELDDSDPWAHLALGYAHFMDRETDKAVRHFRAAMDLNPNFAAAAGLIGFALAHDGQSDEAISYFEQAMRMSPRDPFNSFFYVGIAAAHYLAGRYPEAVKAGHQAVQLRPGYIGAHRILCASLAQDGQIEQAKAEFGTVRRLQPDISIARIRESVPYTTGPMERFLDGLRKAGLTD